MSYDLSSKQFTTHSTTLPVSINCVASCYAQFNQYLYFVTPNDGIGVFDMNTQQIQFPLSSIQSLTARGPETCLAMSNDGKHLFIVGGRSSNDPILTFQIYDIDHGTLVTGPRMSGTRCCFAPGCAVLGNRLYHIGGYERYEGPKGKVEYIDVSNIENIAGQTWYSHGALNTYRSHQRTVVYQGLAYNIGGLALIPGGGELDQFETDTVDHFDCGSGQNVAENSLPFASRKHCVTTTDNAIFVINGQDLYWATPDSATFTCNPTSAPTARPTVNPTANPIPPSTDPTAYPTVNPTADPTTNPSTDPTSDPSTDPTSDPSTDPTSDPSTDPTRYNEAEVHQETTMTTSEEKVVPIIRNDFSLNVVPWIWITGCIIALLLILIVCVVRVLKRQNDVLEQKVTESNLAQDAKPKVESAQLTSPLDTEPRLPEEEPEDDGVYGPGPNKAGDPTTTAMQTEEILEFVADLVVVSSNEVAGEDESENDEFDSLYDNDHDLPTHTTGGVTTTGS